MSPTNLLMMSMVLSLSSLFWLLAVEVLLGGTFFFQFSSPFFCRAASLNERVREGELVAGWGES